MTNWAEKIAIAREARRAGQSLRGEQQETSILVPLRLLRLLVYGMAAGAPYWSALSEARRLLGKDDRTLADIADAADDAGS